MKQLLWLWHFFVELILSAVRRQPPFSQSSKFLNYPNENSHWGNLGYWVTANNKSEKILDYSAAAQQLAKELIYDLPISKPESMLVLGCGAGEEVAYWSRHFPTLRNIQAWDIDKQALAHAEKKLPNVHWYHRSAELLSTKCNDSTDLNFDLVCALDCAYHFKQQNQIWAAAYTRLSSHGVLAFSDLVLADGYLSFWDRAWLRFSSFVFSIPYENWKTQSQYDQNLNEIGFKYIEIIPCSEQVLDGFVKFMKSENPNHDLPKRWQLKSRITAMLIKKLRSRKLIEYVIVQGQK